MAEDNVKAQMRKGILEYCILAILSREDSYAPKIIAELKQAEMIVVEGTLYPILTRQKNAGLLTYRWEESPQGPPRKYYTLTDKGNFEGSNACVRIPSPSSTNTRLRLFSLLPIIK